MWHVAHFATNSGDTESDDYWSREGALISQSNSGKFVQKSYPLRSHNSAIAYHEWIKKDWPNATNESLIFKGKDANKKEILEKVRETMKIAVEKGDPDLLFTLYYNGYGNVEI